MTNKNGSMNPPRGRFRLKCRKCDFDGRASVNGRQHPRGLGDGLEGMGRHSEFAAALVGSAFNIPVSDGPLHAKSSERQKPRLKAEYCERIIAGRCAGGCGE